MNYLEKLKAAYDDIGIEYNAGAERLCDDVYHYLFIGTYRNILHPDATFESADLDFLTNTSKFIEFKNGKLASYSGSSI